MHIKKNINIQRGKYIEDMMKQFTKEKTAWFINIWKMFKPTGIHKNVNN